MDKGNSAGTEEPEARHSQDPYGTPPYGQPGPWAPAPPVPRPTPPTGTQALPGPPAAGQGATPGGTVLPTPPAGTHAPEAQSTAPPVGAQVSGELPGEPLRRYDPWAVPAAAAPAAPVSGPAPPPVPEVVRPRPAVLVVGALLVALVAGLLGGGIGVYLERSGAFSTVRLPQASSRDRPPTPGSVAGIAESVLPGVVTLHVRGSGANGTGTGFVLDDRGHILTNAHVVGPAGSSGVIDVTFHSGDTARAEIVGQDAGYDLAVVKVSGVSGLNPLELGSSDSVRVGDPVIAIGAPFELDGTVTSGIISATERPVISEGREADGSDRSYVSALQTDAAINPGNSGGPLVDRHGRVIGVNSALRGPDTLPGLDQEIGNIGLGFAIPINKAKDIAEQLINTGRATHPVIGVMLDMSYQGDGARVGSTAGAEAVTRGGPGDQAGLEEGDVITAVNNDQVDSGDELLVRIRSHRPGDVLTLTVLRDGGELELPVTLGEEAGD